MCALLALSAAFVAPNARAANSAANAPSGQHITTSHGYSLYNDLRYPASFPYFDYVNPNAPKGGTIRLSGNGSYDSFNLFAVRGTSGLLFYFGLLYDSLMKAAGDGTSAQYCLLCETITYPDDLAWAEYRLRKTAKWHDGKPITPEDVVFSFDTISKKASPVWREGLSNIAKAEVTGPSSVKFTFKRKGDKRQPYYLGFMLIIPKHYWQGKDFEAPAITPPLLSGAYKIGEYDLGRSFTLVRVPDYWGRDLPVNRGQFNYDKIVFDYYRDTVVAFEGFKAGAFDVRMETSPRNWETAYVWPAAKKHEVVKTILVNQNAVNYQGFFLNMRRPQFQDARLREALGYALDFTWLNKNLYYGHFERIKSIFAGSELSAKASPSADELKLLEPFRKSLPARVFGVAYAPPETDGTPEGLRKNLSTAAKILRDAGYTVKSGKLISPKTGKPVEFELTMWDPSFQPAATQWADNLKLLGIAVRLKVMDFAQYQTRMQNFDFDAIIGFVPFLPTPGMELRNLFGSAAATTPGSGNWAGIKDPAVDALNEAIINADTRPELLAATRALDRVLMWNFYTLPMYGSGGKLRIAYWDRFGRPKNELTFGFAWTNTWWIEPQKTVGLKPSNGASQ